MPLRWAGAYFNRSGEAEARIVLTERELDFGWDSMDRHENSGMALQLNWRVEGRDDEGIDYAYSGRYRTAAFLDRAHMAALGFDVPSPSGAAGADEDEASERRYRRQLTRQALLVFEYDGPSWQRVLLHAREAAARHAAAAAANPGSEKFAAKAKSAAEQAALESSAYSRLFAGRRRYRCCRSARALPRPQPLPDPEGKRPAGRAGRQVQAAGRRRQDQRHRGRAGQCAARSARRTRSHPRRPGAARAGQTAALRSAHCHRPAPRTVDRASHGAARSQGRLSASLLPRACLEAAWLRGFRPCTPESRMVA